MTVKILISIKKAQHTHYETRCAWCQFNTFSILLLFDKNSTQFLSFNWTKQHF